MQATNQPLSKSAQSVQDYILDKGFKFEVIELPASTRTAEDAASAICCNVAQIVKSLVFKTCETSQPILILASGSNRVNEKTIAAHIGEAITKADADYAREITGFAIGGIPPVAHKTPIRTLIDADLLQHSTLWAAAGTANAVFSLEAKNLQSLTQGDVITVT